MTIRGERVVSSYAGSDALEKASPVKRGKIPTWLKRVLQREFPDRRLERSGELESRALYELFDPVEVDHCGTTEWHGIRDCFVSEPYHVNMDDLDELTKKGRRLGFTVAYDSLSYHASGACHRIVLFPSTANR